jgi:hypothetical protein
MLPALLSKFTASATTPAGANTHASILATPFSCSRRFRIVMSHYIDCRLILMHFEAIEQVLSRHIATD